MMIQIIEDQKRSSKIYSKPLSLYEQDFLRWSEETAAKLKAGDFESLDLEHLIEEVEALGRSDRKEFLNRLIVIFEHLLKRLYVNSLYYYNGWERTIRTQRTCLKVLLKQSPSLRSNCQESLEDAWQSALENVRDEYSKTIFPDRFPHPTDINSLLNQKYWELDS